MNLKTLLIFFLILILLICSCSLRKEKTLSLYCWEDYISPELINKFEEQNKCKINYKVFNSNEEMLENLKINNNYDIIVPSGDYAQVLINQNYVKKLDKSLLSNYSQLDKIILDKSMIYDSDLQYTIPYFWGVCGLIYNTKFIRFDNEKSVSWNVLGDSKIVSQKVSLLNDPRDLIGISLIVNGFGPNYLNEESLKIAEKTLNSWFKNVLLLDSFNFNSNLINNKIYIAQAYNGDALQFINTNKDFKFILPVEGSTLWIDYLMVGKNSVNTDLAHKFINFLIEKDNASINAMYTNFASPNIEVIKSLPDSIKNNTFIYPDDKYLAKCHLVNNIDYQGLSYLNFWKRIQSNIQH